MPVPMPAPEGGSLDDVEASAWADIKAAISGDNDEAGIAALRDFVRACLKREASEEYTETE
jgi:hypothetical protein